MCAVPKEVTAVASNPGGILLATAGEYGTVRLSDPATGKPVGKPVIGHTDVLPRWAPVTEHDSWPS